MAKRNKKLRTYPSKYPCHVDSSLCDSEWRKERTLELYSYLPQTTLEERVTYTDIRDEVIYLNYKFFGYVASHVYLNGQFVSYEDKFQSALLNFCTMWHKFMFGKKYRTDLAFSVFFKPRLSECVYRELGTVKHTVNRSLKMEAAEQLGIHYSKLRYEDLSKVTMNPQHMAALKAIFHADFEEDLDTASIFIPVSGDTTEYDEELYSDNYNDVVHLLMHEMIDREHLLTLDDLMDISNLLDIPVCELKEKLPEAEHTLYTTLQDTSSYKKSFSDI